MSDLEVGSGVIRWVDLKREFGIIIEKGEGKEASEDVYFEFKDVVIGEPQEGAMVHYIREQERQYGTVAKNIAVISRPDMKQKSSSY